MTEIEGKVAQIIDRYTIVINRGKSDEVENDMRFIIYEKGDEITDPDSGESLGIFENIKMKVKIVNVNENISTAKSDEKYKVTTPSSLNFNYLGSSSRTEIKELPLDQETREKLFNHKMSGVKIGDLVRQILD